MTVFTIPAKDAHAFLKSRIEKWKSPLTLSWEKTGVIPPVNVEIVETGGTYRVTISNTDLRVLSEESV